MSIHGNVLDRAHADPDGAAFATAAGPITRGAVLSTVESLVRQLHAVGAGARVAVVSAKKPGTVAAMLAVLASGRSYVPIDPAAPADRIRFILQDSDCSAAIVDEAVTLADDWPVPVITTAVGSTAPKRSLAPRSEPQPDEEAYVLYTSGSTGEPKGVVISHRNAAAFVRWAARHFPLGPTDRVAVHAPLHFDLSVYDVYVGMAAGATLHMVPERVALFPQALRQFLAAEEITSLYAVPSALTALVTRSDLGPGDLPELRQLLYAGEEFQPTPLRRLWSAMPNAAVINLYGPIETNVVTCHRLERSDLDRARIPLGRPVDGALVGLLDHDGRVSTSGPGEGEIVVAGDCVMAGYLHRPDLTAAASLDADAGAGRHRFHRTGDYAVRDEGGVLHLLGRRDGLVKTRGYRVELGEIESVISRHPDVGEVAVLAVADPELTHRLHAVVVPRHRGADVTESVFRHCRQSLPGYMVPTVHVRPDLPRTSTGKVARSALRNEVTGA